MAIDARNLAPLPADVELTAGWSPPISTLTAWQGCSNTASCGQGRAFSRTLSVVAC